MNKQAGAVSLFIVVFATLLMSVVTVSFLRLMVNDQNRASNNDLSQSAYDSAQAGVEDGKRALLRYQKLCATSSKAACTAAAASINDVACNAALRVGDVVGSDAVDPGEIKIQQTVSEEGDSTLDQAYTCVTIKLQTDDYLGSISAGQSKLVPLVGAASYDTVTVEWYSAEDIGKSAAGLSKTSLDPTASPQRLLPKSSWPSNRPSVLRTELMQFGTSFKLSDFDATNSSSQSNANTIFMYPTSGIGSAVNNLTVSDQRQQDANGDVPQKAGSDTPFPVHCEVNLPAGGYACTQSFRVPTPVGGGARTAFLRLTPMYNATHFRVTLASNNGTIPVKFNAVQPEIDSTGRANDLFRRIASRVDLIDTSFPYPEGAVDVTGNICKDFGVTDTQYLKSSAATCTP